MVSQCECLITLYNVRLVCCYIHISLVSLGVIASVSYSCCYLIVVLLVNSSRGRRLKEGNKKEEKGVFLLADFVAGRFCRCSALQLTSGVYVFSLISNFYPFCASLCGTRSVVSIISLPQLLQYLPFSLLLAIQHPVLYPVGFMPSVLYLLFPCYHSYYCRYYKYHLYSYNYRQQHLSCGIETSRCTYRHYDTFCDIVDIGLINLIIR